MKGVYLIFVLILACDASAIDIKKDCESPDLFFPYKAGIQAEKDNLIQQAFAIFCNLAFKGDYRAQFKLAQYYHQGIEDVVQQDQEVAYLWARLSNAYVISKKRTIFIEKIYQAFDAEKKQRLNKLALGLLQTIPTGARIDMQYKPIDYKKLWKQQKKKNEPKKQTWTNIKKRNN